MLGQTQSVDAHLTESFWTKRLIFQTVKCPEYLHHSITSPFLATMRLFERKKKILFVLEVGKHFLQGSWPPHLSQSDSVQRLQGEGHRRHKQPTQSALCFGGARQMEQVLAVAVLPWPLIRRLLFFTGKAYEFLREN